MVKPLEPFPAFPDEPQPGYEPEARVPVPKKHRLPMLLAILAVAAVLGAGGAGAYWFLARHSKTPAAAQQKTAAGQPQTVRTEPPAPSPSSSAPYTSNGQDLNLSFTYPADWSVSPLSGKNSSDQPIIVTSPTDTITDSAGKSVTGQVIVSIRPGSAQLSELASGSAIVVQDSVQIGYTKPTASQHQYPYLTYVRLSGGDANNGFDEVIITGISKFTKGQNLSAESLGQLDPIITARFYTCTAACDSASRSALLIVNSTWQTGDPFTKALALFQSLQLR